MCVCARTRVCACIHVGHSLARGIFICVFLLIFWDRLSLNLSFAVYRAPPLHSSARVTGVCCPVPSFHVDTVGSAQVLQLAPYVPSSLSHFLAWKEQLSPFHSSRDFHAQKPERVFDFSLYPRIWERSICVSQFLSCRVFAVPQCILRVTIRPYKSLQKKMIRVKDYQAVSSMFAQLLREGPWRSADTASRSAGGLAKHAWVHGHHPRCCVWIHAYFLLKLYLPWTPNKVKHSCELCSLM